jgi:transketolase
VDQAVRISGLNPRPFANAIRFLAIDAVEAANSGHPGMPPPGPCRITVEAGTGQGWYKYVGLNGGVIGLDRFGESAPGGELFKHFGFVPARIAEAVLALVGN